MGIPLVITWFQLVRVELLEVSPNILLFGFSSYLHLDRHVILIDYICSPSVGKSHMYGTSLQMSFSMLSLTLTSIHASYNQYGHLKYLEWMS